MGTGWHQGAGGAPRGTPACERGRERSSRRGTSAGPPSPPPCPPNGRLSLRVCSGDADAAAPPRGAIRAPPAAAAPRGGRARDPRPRGEGFGGTPAGCSSSHGDCESIPAGLCFLTEQPALSSPPPPRQLSGTLPALRRAGRGHRLAGPPPGAVTSLARSTLPAVTSQVAGASQLPCSCRCDMPVCGGEVPVPHRAGHQESTERCRGEQRPPVPGARRDSSGTRSRQ